jgi:hypothetical protein
LRERNEVVVAHDLQPHESRDHRTERKHHDHRSRHRTPLEELLLGMVIFDTDGGHGQEGYGLWATGYGVEE